MNSQEIIELIEAHPKWYQKIELPNGISTPGRDRSKTADSIFPKDLTGKTVLDVGCAEGYFSFEAKKRNAEKVVGIDFDTDKLKIAKKFSEFQKLDIDFQNLDLDQLDDADTYDYVICLNILHHVTDPIMTINKLINKTKVKLSLEVADLTMGISDIGKKKRSKALLGLWGSIFKYLPESLKPGILAVDSRARFLISRKWIKNLIETQYPDIEKLEFLDSELEHRYIIDAQMRNIDELSIISGPTNIGKSTLIGMLKSGNRDSFDLTGIDPVKNWSILTASELQKTPGMEIEDLILEYDLCRTILKRYGIFEYDPVVRLFRNSNLKTVYVLVYNRDKYLKRVEECLNKLSKPKKKDREKAQRMITEFSHASKYVGIYYDWIDFCKSNGCNIKYISMVNESVKVINEEEALRIIKS